MASAILINLSVYEGTIGQSCVMCSPTESSSEVYDDKKQKCTLVFEGRVMAKNAWPIERYGIARGGGDLIEVILRKNKEEGHSKLLKLTKHVVRFNPEVLRTPKSDNECSLELFSCTDLPIPSVLQDLAEATRKGLSIYDPTPTNSGGKGGSYFMHDESSGQFKSVFKPMDEEPGAENDPRGKVSKSGCGLKCGVMAPQGYIREAAAYILDHRKRGDRASSDHFGFSGVPPTCLVKVFHPKFIHPGGVTKEKTGSLQLFMKSDLSCDLSCDDIGTGIIKNFTSCEVHKIAVLDIRYVNVDRHPGNILVAKQGGYHQLIPIDHGYCFPSSFEDVTFDVLKDLVLLKDYGWEMPKLNARVFMTGTPFLKMCVEKGLTAHQIGSSMVRDEDPNNDEISTIEEIFEAANTAVPEEMEGKVFIDELERLIGNFLDGFVT